MDVINFVTLGGIKIPQVTSRILCLKLKYLGAINKIAKHL